MRLDFLKIESYRRGIILSSGFNFIAKALLFVQNVAIAYYFGAQAKTDIYFYCLAVIFVMTGFITNLNSSVLIPESMRLNIQESREKSMRFLNFFLYLYLVLGFVVSLIFYLNPVGIFHMLSRFNQSILQDNTGILLLSIPLFTLIIIMTFLTDILVSYKFFTMTMITTTVNSLFALLFICLFHSKLDVISISLGLIFGYSINVAMLTYLLKKGIGWDFKFRWIETDRKNWHNIIFIQFGNIASALSGYVPIFLLSGFSPGIITALNYGQRSSDMINQLITLQASSIVGVKFNELYANRNFEKLNSIFSDSINTLLFILLPISCLIYIYSNEIVSIIFKRGVLGISSIYITSDFFKYFSFLLPLLAISAIVTRIFLAGQKIREVIWYQVILNTILVVLTFVCIKNFGYLGYPISLIIIYTLNAIAVYFLLKAFFPMIEYGNVVVYFIMTSFLNIALTCLILKFKNLFGSMNMIGNLMSGSVLYIFILVLLNRIFNFNKTINYYLSSCMKALRKMVVTIG